MNYALCLWKEVSVKVCMVCKKTVGLSVTLIYILDILLWRNEYGKSPKPKWFQFLNAIKQLTAFFVFPYTLPYNKPPSWKEIKITPHVLVGFRPNQKTTKYFRILKLNIYGVTLYIKFPCTEWT